MSFACSVCEAPISVQNRSGMCRTCVRRNRGKVTLRDMGDCGDCGKRLGPCNRSGFCSKCNTRRLNADPEFNARRLEGLHRKWEDPEFAEVARKRAQRLGQKYSIDPDVQARRIAWGKYAYANWLGTPEIRERANKSPMRGKNLSEARMAWCPPEMRDRYRYLVRSKKLRKAEARKVIEKEWADRQALKHVDSALDHLRRFAPVRTEENGYRVGFSDLLRPSEVIERAKLRGWEPERLAA